MIKLWRLTGMATLALAAAPVFGQTQSHPKQSAAAPSSANQVLVKVKPHFISGSEAEFPAEAKALGQHGTVMIGFEIDASGAVLNAYVKRSSGSDLLDASALATAKTARFSPAFDANGTAIPLKFQAPYDFYQSRSSEPGGGFVHYRCSAFTAEMDWWEATQPEKEGRRDRDEVYSFLLGLRVISFPGGMMAGLRDGKVTGAHEKDWNNARKKCRANPDALVVDYLEQRDMLLALAKQEAARVKQ